MISEQSTPLLDSLQVEILELNRSLEELRALVLAKAPELDRKARIQQAKSEIFTEYDSLLSKLAK